MDQAVWEPVGPGVSHHCPLEKLQVELLGIEAGAFCMPGTEAKGTRLVFEVRRTLLPLRSVLLPCQRFQREAGIFCVQRPW